MASIVPIFVPHAGCPCRCVFCNQRAIAGQSERMTPERADAILEQALSALSADAPAPQAAFYGGSFTAIAQDEQEALLAVTDRYIANGRLSDVRCSTRPDAVDAQTLARLARHGMTTVELGAQSMDDAVLRLSKRGHTAADTIRAARCVKAAGMQLVLQTMVGLPGDTREKAVQTAHSIAQQKPDGVRIYPTAVLPHTALFALWQAGAYQPLDNAQAAVWCADMLEIFLQAGIPVIRIGLNPTPELDRSVAAGAYHPAMGELVWSELWYRRLRAQLEDGADGTFYVPPRELSRAVGYRRQNITRLQTEFPQRRIRIHPAEDSSK